MAARSLINSGRGKGNAMFGPLGLDDAFLPLYVTAHIAQDEPAGFYFIVWFLIVGHFYGKLLIL